MGGETNVCFCWKLQSGPLTPTHLHQMSRRWWLNSAFAFKNWVYSDFYKNDMCFYISVYFSCIFSIFMEKPLYAAFLALFFMGTGQMTQKTTHFSLHGHFLYKETTWNIIVFIFKLKCTINVCSFERKRHQGEVHNDLCVSLVVVSVSQSNSITP